MLSGDPWISAVITFISMSGGGKGIVAQGTENTAANNK